MFVIIMFVVLDYAYVRFRWGTVSVMTFTYLVVLFECLLLSMM